MNAMAIIDEIRDEGGNLQVEGTDIVLSAAQPLPAALVKQVRAHKTEILDTLAGLDALASAFHATGRIRIESDWAGTVWLVASATHLRHNETGSVYFPNEIPFLVDLSPDERRLMNTFKRLFGGTIEVRPWNESR